MKKFKIVEVEWIDAQSSLESFTLQEIERFLKPLHTKSVGYLVYECSDWIVLGFTDFGNGVIKHHQLIPRKMLVSITVRR